MLSDTQKKDTRLPQFTLRAESPSIFREKSGREGDSAYRLHFLLSTNHPKKLDESVQFRTGQTGFPPGGHAQTLESLAFSAPTAYCLQS